MSQSCSPFLINGDSDQDGRCRCPKCGGFLPDFPLDKQFVCPKCRSVLETMPGLPDEDESTSLNFDAYEDRKINEDDAWMLGSAARSLFDEPPPPEPGDPYDDGGRICVVPAYAVKIVVPPKVRRVRPRMEKTRLIALGHGWARRVWVNEKDEKFIRFGSDHVSITDPCVVKVLDEEALA